MTSEPLYLPLRVSFARFASEVSALCERLPNADAAQTILGHVVNIRAHLGELARAPSTIPIEDETWAAAAKALALCDDAELAVMPRAQDVLRACRALEAHPRRHRLLRTKKRA